MSVEKITQVGGFARFSKDEISFTVIPNESLNLIESLELRGLWVSLLSRPSDWKIYKNELKDHFGLGHNKLDKYFTKLAKLGLLTITKVRDENGLFCDTDYRIHLFSIVCPSTPMETVALDNQGHGYETLQSNRRNKEKEETNIGHSENDRDSDNLFSDFYRAYPKKVKKDRALKVWESKQLWKHSEDIMANIEQRKKCQMHWVTCKGQQKQFIPAPDVYLNNKGWEDELELSHKDCKSCNAQSKSSVYDMGMG